MVVRIMAPVMSGPKSWNLEMLPYLEKDALADLEMER